ncbi:MAG: DUF2752 domain-containing protein [Bacteroides sp.]|nr:DUF2752 domain-containing protein [Bacteroides sp.]
MKQKSLWATIGLITLAVLFYCCNPCDYSLFPKCPFLWLTGLQCPGCGSQRAIHCLLHLDVIQAFYYNALLVFSLPIILILSLAEYYRYNKPAFYVKVHKRIYIWCYIAIIVVWWIIRNIFNF